MKPAVRRRPPEHCPRSSGCSVAICPLDPEQAKRVSLPGEPRCELGKARRTRIAAEFPELLPERGLSATEFARWLDWETMPEGEKRRRLETLKAARLRSHVGRSSTDSEGDTTDPGQDSAPRVSASQAVGEEP
ncbi:hypothetical protein [Anaeromyxobacter terrae]|uniref:hypothetical protein n=1 Tax=Anaeromyxobacter terrae TaxID=2925406 RepID=UPI001F5AE09D|nr:hypothetical protein [Anaeromyxobacter sp. SG22]